MDDSRTYASEYEGPSYEFTTSVTNLSRLPRFGHGSDFTLLLSSDPADQADYSAGLMSLFIFLLIVFVFWTIALLVFKVMGPANAGFLSGHRMVVERPDDKKNARKRPLRVRAAFLTAAAVSMVSAFLFVAKGLTNVNDAATTMSRSLDRTAELLGSAEAIAANLEDVGERSIAIRDDALQELGDLCPANPNIGDELGLMGTADRARSDLTMLADFISDGLGVLNEELPKVRDFFTQAEQVTTAVDLWEWPMKLLVAGMYVLPSFLAMGVGLVMLDIDERHYQMALTYFFMPTYFLTIVACYIFCCALLPISAISADACSGGGSVAGGPDDTVLTVYRNLMGADTGMIFQFVAFYTQQCNDEYYPFGLLSSYFNDLDNAVDSTKDALDALSINQPLLEAQCSRKFDTVIDIVDRMNINLKLLRRQADLTLNLVKCENINQLYVNTVHEAGCTYSVDAMAWIFASSLLISVCGLIMIMLRSAYLPVEFLEPGDAWVANPAITKSTSRDSPERTDPVERGTSRLRRPSAAAADPDEIQACGSAASGSASGCPRGSTAPSPAINSRFVNVSQVNDNEFEFEDGGSVGSF